MTGLLLLASIAMADPGSVNTAAVDLLADDDSFTRAFAAPNVNFGSIVNGIETDGYPNVVALAGISGGYNYVWCSGTLIDPNFVLTAAHCVDSVSYVQSIGLTPYVIFGSDLYGGFTDAIEIVGYAEHPSYSGEYLLNDIGIVELGSPATGIDLAVLNDEPVTSSWIGTTMTMLGFGVIFDDGPGSGTKRMTDLDVVGYSNQFIETYTPGTNLCSGDSGGPGFENTSYGTQELAGVNSYVSPACVDGGAGVTRVDQHIDWIQGFAPTVLLGGSGEGSNPYTPAGEGGGPAPDVDASSFDQDFADPLTPSKGAFPVGVRCDMGASGSPLGSIWIILGMVLIIRRNRNA
jgi:secreted trypsin-like serine protease